MIECRWWYGSGQLLTSFNRAVEAYFPSSIEYMLPHYDFVSRLSCTADLRFAYRRFR